MGRSVGLLGIVFVLMLSAGLWLAQSHGNPARSVEDAAFCAHVADLSTTLTEVPSSSIVRFPPFDHCIAFGYRDLMEIREAVTDFVQTIATHAAYRANA